MPSYGRLNFDLLATWADRAPEHDGPVWCLNLMKYKPVAAYADGDGGDTPVSGREADDRYAPTDVLERIGAELCYVADVVDQRSGEPTWDRVAVARYPTRRSFVEMNTRTDFKEKHVHKEAGMEFTIILATHPDGPTTLLDREALKTGTTVLRVARTPGSALPEVAGATRLATFTVEGVVVGDDRTWNRVAYDFAPDADVTAALLAATGDADEIHAIALRPRRDRLVASVDEHRLDGPGRTAGA